jgi:hypothetical protein
MRIHRLIVIEAMQRIGLPGLAGAALAFASLAFALTVLWPAAQESAANRLRVEAKGRFAAPVDAGRAPPSSAEQLAAFYGALPAQQEATKWIERIYAAARKEGVVLRKGEYTLAADPNANIARYQILLPVHSDYRKIRRFIQVALATVPGLGLDDVSMERQHIADGELEARIRMTLYVGRS